MDVTQWDSPETYFSWEHVQKYIDRIDSTVYRIAVKVAHELFLDDATDCPLCGKSAADLFWFSVSTSVSDWESGRGRVGFLTLCKDCRVQVGFYVDVELTEIQAEEFARSGSVD